MGLNLKEVVARLNTFAPLSLAASWDNVGLLIEPSGLFKGFLQCCGSITFLCGSGFGTAVPCL